MGADEESSHQEAASEKDRGDASGQRHETIMPVATMRGAFPCSD
jgi:hypothetical protein